MRIKTTILFFLLFTFIFSPSSAFSYSFPDKFILDFTIKQDKKKNIIINGKTNLPNDTEVWVDILGGENYFAETLFDGGYVKVKNGKFTYKSRSHYPLKYSIIVKFGNSYGATKKNNKIFGKNFKELKRGVIDGKMSKDEDGYYNISKTRIFRIGTNADEKKVLKDNFEIIKKKYNYIKNMYRRILTIDGYLLDTNDYKGFHNKIHELNREKEKKEEWMKNPNMFFWETNNNLKGAWSYLDVLISYTSSRLVKQALSVERELLIDYNEAKTRIKYISKQLK